MAAQEHELQGGASTLQFHHGQVRCLIFSLFERMVQTQLMPCIPLLLDQLECSVFPNEHVGHCRRPGASMCNAKSPKTRAYRGSGVG